MPEPKRGRLPQRLPYDQDEVDAPRVMVASAASLAPLGLTQLLARPVVGGHDVRQLMQAGMFAPGDIEAVVRAQRHPAQDGVGAANSTAAHDGDGIGVRRERGLKPLHLLDGMNVDRALPVADDPVVNSKHRPSQLAGRQPRR